VAILAHHYLYAVGTFVILKVIALVSPLRASQKERESAWTSLSTGKKRTAGAKAPFSFTQTEADI